MESTNYGTYRIVSPSGSSYVGMTTRTFAERWAAHLRELRIGKQYKCLGLKRAYAKYGEQNLKFEILEILTGSPKKEVWLKEMYWWDKLHDQGINLYNSRPTGTGSEFHSEETKNKISASRRKSIELPKNEIANLQALVDKTPLNDLIRETGYSLRQLKRRGVILPKKIIASPISTCIVCGANFSGNGRKTCSDFCLEYRSKEFRNESKILINKDVLEDLYSIQKLSSTQIAKMFNTSAPTVRARLRDFGIEVRSRY